jgi:integrase
LVSSSGKAKAKAITTDDVSSSTLTLEGSLYETFINAIRSEVTRKNYTFAIKKYMQYQKFNKLEDLLTYSSSSSLPTDTKLIESRIISYIVHLKNVEKIGHGTINGYIAAIMLFYAVNDINLNRKKIALYLPEQQKISDDRGYSTEEIAKMLEASDNRVRALILLLASTGVRIGSVADLKLKHLHMIPKYGIYKIIVYAGYKEEYFCFTTTEAANAIQTYLQFRERYGEKVTPESYLFREQFNLVDHFDCKNPKKVQFGGLSKLIADTAIRSGIVEKGSLLEDQKAGKKRNKIFRTHGFRKTVTTKMIEAGLSDFAIEKLLGHKSKGGITSKHYYRPQEEDLLTEYLKAVDFLTIDDSQHLRHENEILKVKKSEYEYLKEQIEETKREQAKFTSNYMAYLKSKLGIPKEVNEINLTFDPNEHDLDKELGY